MDKRIYKTDYFKFSIFLASAERFNKKLQEVIDKNAEDGWKLHSWNILTLEEFCSLVFYKEED